MRREIGLVRAWLLVDSLNRSFRAPVIASQKGGQHGGGAFLTEFGQAVVQHFARQTVMTAAAHQIVTGAYAMRYREMDRAQLDAAHNNSAAVPERDAIVADWAARSARVRREYVGRLELAYGDTPRERLDLFLAADPKAPTLAFIHGGYWQMNDKESFAFFAEGLLPLGINLAVIEYTLAPAARLNRIVAEVRRSVRWLAEHLGEHGADANRLYVAGHSAGGHLTAMTMPLAEVRGGIAISGIYDLEPIRLNTSTRSWVSMRPRPNATARSGICRRRPVSWSWLTARGNCPNCVASRSSRPGVDRARPFGAPAAGRRR
jgi:molybdate transport repressor ModE-like protein